MINYQKIISDIYHELKNEEDTGQVAAYIPELGNVDPDKFGVHLTTVDDQHYFIGDSEEKFSIQSIAKVLSLVLASKLGPELLTDRVGV